MLIKMQEMFHVVGGVAVPLYLNWLFTALARVKTEHSAAVLQTFTSAAINQLFWGGDGVEGGPSVWAPFVSPRPRWSQQGHPSLWSQTWWMDPNGFSLAEMTGFCAHWLTLLWSLVFHFTVLPLRMRPTQRAWRDGECVGVGILLWMQIIDNLSVEIQMVLRLWGVNSKYRS